MVCRDKEQALSHECGSACSLFGWLDLVWKCYTVRASVVDSDPQATLNARLWARCSAVGARLHVPILRKKLRCKSGWLVRGGVLSDFGEAPELGRGELVGLLKEPIEGTH